MADEENAYTFTTTATRHITLGNLPDGGLKMWRGGCLPGGTLQFDFGCKFLGHFRRIPLPST